jgi:DNA polymerase family A
MSLCRSGLDVTAVELPFARVILEDFEFIAEPGERPDVVCGAFFDLSTGQTTLRWRDELDAYGLPYDPQRADTLVVSFVFNAEGCCHLALGQPLPRNVIDLSVEFKCFVNGKGIPRKNQGLIGALQYFGLSTITPKRKDAMRDRIMQGWPFTPEEKKQIGDYCIGDTKDLHPLLFKLLPHIDLPIALHRGEGVAVLARSEHIGVPIDMETFPPLVDKETWRDIRDSMVPLVDVHGIYVWDKNGWHWSQERFEQWLGSEGIIWPRKEKTGKLDMRRKTFESMAKAYPQLEPLRQLRYIRDKLRTIKLSVGRDGRNRTVLWPFSSKTSRTQPKASRWIFSPSVWLRFAIKPERGRALAYIDYSSMEFLGAAALSNKHTGAANPMLELYQSGDPHLNFGKIIGYIPQDATRKTPGVEAIRDRLKTMCLGVQYGMQIATLATRLGVSDIEAHEMLLHHRGLFSQYWHWSDDWLQRVLNSGEMRTVYGWQCATGITEFNERSIRNWPIQSNCADLFRLAYVWGTRRGLTLVAPVHDAVLLEAPEDRIEQDVALMREIMRRASRVIFNPTADGTIELRTDVKIIRYPNRFTDPRGAELWATVLKLLAERRERQAQRAREAI